MYITGMKQEHFVPIFEMPTDDELQAVRESLAESVSFVIGSVLHCPIQSKTRRAIGSVELLFLSCVAGEAGGDYLMGVCVCVIERTLYHKRIVGTFQSRDGGVGRVGRVGVGMGRA